MFRVYVRNKSERRWFELNALGLPVSFGLEKPLFHTREEALKALCSYELDVTSPIQASFDFKANQYVSEFSVKIIKEL